MNKLLQRLRHGARILLSALVRGARWLRERWLLERLPARAVWLRLWSYVAGWIRRIYPRVAWVAGVGILSLAVTGAGGAIVAATTERVPATRVGVRRSLMGGGVDERDYTPGLYASITGWHAWSLLDARTHLCVFAPTEEGGYFPRLAVRTKDGNSAEVAVTVAYRIQPGQAHAVVRDGLRSAYRKQARALSEKVLLAEFAELSSEDLMSTDARDERAATACERLNDALGKFHLEALAVRISGVQFPAPFEAKLQEKQLTEQMALMARAAAEVESELEPARLQKEIAAEVQRVQAELDLSIAQMKAENDRAVAAAKLAAERYENERREAAESAFADALASGERVLREAESLREELIGQALQGEGGRLWLAREAARNLHLDRVTLDSSDPRVPMVLDLGELVDLLVAGD